MKNLGRFGAGLLAGALFAVFVMRFPDTSQDWAAWVQAFGSIVAILFAWYSGERQGSQQETLRATERWLARLEAANLGSSIAAQCEIVMKHTHVKFLESRGGGWSEIGPERIEELLSAIRILLGKEIPPALFDALLPLQRELSYTATAVRQYNHGRHPARDERIEKARRRVAAVAAAQKELADLASFYRDRLRISRNGEPQHDVISEEAKPKA
jgi:hypothetical protein